MGVGDQRLAPVSLFSGKRSYSRYRGGSEAPGPVWMGARNFASAGIRSPDRPARSEWLTGVEGERVSLC